MEETIALDRHPGILNPDGTVIVYNVLFYSVRQAIDFLRPYPFGPKYMGCMVDGNICLVSVHQLD
jgi:hypothetical protein